MDFITSNEVAITALKTATGSQTTVQLGIVGLVAGLALAGGGLMLRLTAGIPTISELVQDRLLELLPGSVLSRLIDTFQFRARPLLLLCTTGVQVLGGIAFACLLGALARRYGRWLAGGIIVLAGVAMGLLYWMALTVALPLLLGLGVLYTRIADGPGAVIWMLPLYAGYGVSLVGLSALYGKALLPVPREESAHPPTYRPNGHARRRLLSLVVSSAAAALAAGSYWRLISEGDERETDSALTSPISSNSQFYVVSKNYVDPELAAERWHLELNGLIDRPLTLSYTDLLAFAPVELPMTLECISNGVGGKLISMARWTGAPLTAILRHAVPADAARWVVFSCADGYEESVPLDVALRDTTLLAYIMNGVPLPASHGFPVRVLIAGRYGMKNPKWLTGIRLVAEPYQSIWERTGWNGDLGVETMARVDTRPSRPRIGDAVLLGGVAFAGDRGISSVEVSTDGGDTWDAAELESPAGTFTWSRWTYRWLVQHGGSTKIVVRAVDGAGSPQAAVRRFSFPSGATGYHNVTVQVV